MDIGTWIALGSLVLAINVVTVGCAVWIVRAAPRAVHDHEIECANHEPNTAVQLRALSGDP